VDDMSIESVGYKRALKFMIIDKLVIGLVLVIIGVIGNHLIESNNRKFDLEIERFKATKDQHLLMLEKSFSDYFNAKDEKFKKEIDKARHQQEYRLIEIKHQQDRSIEQLRLSYDDYKSTLEAQAEKERVLLQQTLDIGSQKLKIEESKISQVLQTELDARLGVFSDALKQLENGRESSKDSYLKISQHLAVLLIDDKKKGWCKKLKRLVITEYLFMSQPVINKLGSMYTENVINSGTKKEVVIFEILKLMKSEVRLDVDESTPNKQFNVTRNSWPRSLRSQLWPTIT
jgi:hypothetical protein